MNDLDYNLLDVEKATVNANRTFKIIQSTEKQHFPRDLVFYDIETDPTTTSENIKTHFFKLGFMTHCTLEKNGSLKKTTEYVQHKEHEVFEDLMRILKGRNKILIFAHNQNYDFVASNMLYYFTNSGWEIELFNPESKAFLVKFTKGRKTAFFIDSLNFFAGSVKSIGEALNFPKLKMPKVVKKYEKELEDVDFDLEQISDKCYQYYERWLIYNKRDVEIIQKAILDLISFISENGYGSFAYNNCWPFLFYFQTSIHE